MKLSTVFVSFAPPPRDVIIVIIPYKVGGGANETFYRFVSFAPPPRDVISCNYTV